jgi:BlaI family transcriptional regulator, penicillinase repressor
MALRQSAKLQVLNSRWKARFLGEGHGSGTSSSLRGVRVSRPIVIPTAAEFRLLEILWRLKEGTIEDFVRASEKDSALNYKTVQTVLRIMENKKFVTHSLRGRAFVYRPRVQRHEVSRVSLRSLLERYFRGSRSELLVNLLENERIGAGELEELEGLIRSYRKASIAGRKTHR